jgi:glycosyltransferase involved in cell wall biosynthesis
VICLGRIDYGQLGAYIQSADVFIFPTYEDTWGMSAVEAMAFGKPILCSKHSGASELVNDGGNGYLIEPKDPENIALKMESLISDPALIHQMSIKAETLATQIDVSKAIEILEKAIDAVVQL